MAKLEQSLDTGMRALGAANGLAVTFAFDVLPDGLAELPASNGLLLDALAERRRLQTEG